MPRVLLLPCLLLVLIACTPPRSAIYVDYSITTGPMSPIPAVDWELGGRVSHASCSDRWDVGEAVKSWLNIEAELTGAIGMSGVIVERYGTFVGDVKDQACVRVSAVPIVPK